MQSDKDVINRWSSVASFWEKHSEILRPMFAPVTHALIEDALIGKGQTVLDIATGPGEPALTVASLVGPEGKVIGIDPVVGMVEAARREANRFGLRNTKFEVALTDCLPFPSNGFDAVISRFGVMFISSTIGSIREMLRVLKPGGRLAFAVWHLAEQNPFFSVLSKVISRHIDSPPIPPDAPDAFRYATSGKLLNILRQVEVATPSERTLDFRIEASITPEDLWTLRCEMSETLQGKLAALSAEQLAEVRHQALEAFRDYSSDGAMSFPAKVLIVSGSKEV